MQERKNSLRYYLWNTWATTTKQTNLNKIGEMRASEKHKMKEEIYFHKKKKGQKKRQKGQKKKDKSYKDFVWFWCEQFDVSIYGNSHITLCIFPMNRKFVVRKNGGVRIDVVDGHFDCREHAYSSTPSTTERQQAHQENSLSNITLHDIWGYEAFI